MTTRREFISHLSQASALAFMPLPGSRLLSETPFNPATAIDAVEILRVTGPYTSITGINHQYQAQPIHIYPDQRPAPYKETSPTASTGSLTHDYLRIRTHGGV